MKAQMIFFFFLGCHAELFQDDYRGLLNKTLFENVINNLNLFEAAD